MKDSLRKVVRWPWIMACLVLPIIVIVISGYRKSDSLDSYLTDLKSARSVRFLRNLGNVELRNRWYRLLIDTAGTIQVTTPDGQPILDDLAYYAHYLGSDGPVKLGDVCVQKTSDSVAVVSGNTEPGAHVTISVTVGKESPEASFFIKTSYHDSVIVSREALVADYEIPVSEVYQKNRQVVRNKFHNEYWLDKQGVKLGYGARSSLIYYQPDISSLQLDTRRETVVINLDASFDHPFIHIPFQREGTGKWVDKSASAYNSGNERTNCFSVFFGINPDYVPRVMNVPDGYISGYAFTEHADGGTLRTHRAAYFGNESITEINDAKGGFAGHQIPVTKSVFYEDFDQGLSDSLDPNYKDENEYLRLLDQLSSKGNCEICLHTPESSNSSRRVLEEAISTVGNRYGSPTWIDHGMYSGNDNRETLVSDGLNPGSEYYAADLWQNHGIRYFWSPAVEAIRFSKIESSLKNDLQNLKFSHFTGELWRRYKYCRKYLGESSISSIKRIARGHFPLAELNSFQPRRGSTLPTPLFWQNETTSGPFYSWSTEFVYPGLNARDSSLWYENEKKELGLLLDGWGVFINHGYYVRRGGKDNFIENDKKELVVDPEFDQILTYMDQIRDDGDLLIATVRDLLDYWILTEGISFDYMPDGSVIVINNSNEMIKGFSLAVSAGKCSILVDGIAPLSRYYKDDAIIWFDFPPHAQRKIEFVN
jgi:hypothetical protein